MKFCNTARRIFSRLIDYKRLAFDFEIKYYPMAVLERKLS
jgi:hypothetical protein